MSFSCGFEVDGTFNRVNSSFDNTGLLVFKNANRIDLHKLNDIFRKLQEDHAFTEKNTLRVMKCLHQSGQIT